MGLSLKVMDWFTWWRTRQGSTAFTVALALLAAFTQIQNEMQEDLKTGSLARKVACLKLQLKKMQLLKRLVPLKTSQELCTGQSKHA